MWWGFGMSNAELSYIVKFACVLFFDYTVLKFLESLHLPEGLFVVAMPVSMLVVGMLVWRFLEKVERRR